jgi:hypothetical protein
VAALAEPEIPTSLVRDTDSPVVASSVAAARQVR